MINISVRDLQRVTRELQDTNKKAETFMARTMSDAKKRGPGWIAQGVAEEYKTTRKAVTSGKPILGICLGMQMLGLCSEEGHSAGLGCLPFSMRRFHLEDHPELKVPHMGWDRVEIMQPEASLVQGLEQPARFYFVHSYYAVCEDPKDVLMECDYGVRFAAAVHRGNVWGVQFHPEKSHRFGLQLLTSFSRG